MKKILLMTVVCCMLLSSFSAFAAAENIIIDGTNVTIVKQEGNKITIKVTNGDVDKIVANAIVKDADSGKQPTDDNKSPATGAAAATGLVVAGVGVALLSLTKKEKDAE